MEIFGIYFGVKSGSIPAVEVGDGARYWCALLGALGVIEEIKRPCGGRGLAGYTGVIRGSQEEHSANCANLLSVLQ